MQKSSQINIRFDPAMDADLSRTAKALGISRSALVRRLTEVFLNDVKQKGGVSLNPTWVAEVHKADGRSGGDYKLPPQTLEEPKKAPPHKKAKGD